MNFKVLIEDYMTKGYGYDDATSKIAQDIILYSISKSKFSRHITVKGGVVMHNISNNLRRATQDLDLDFIKYSLDDNSILNFINLLNNASEDINIEIIGRIKELHHQAYSGKRVSIRISDKYENHLLTHLDIGVNNNFDLKQEEYYFNLDLFGRGVTLLINSSEQIFTEKLKSLLIWMNRTTRYKDLFDFYYLITENKLDKGKLCECMQSLIYSDKQLNRHKIFNKDDVVRILSNTLYSYDFRRYLSNPKVNWLDVDIDEAIRIVISYISSLEPITS